MTPTSPMIWPRPDITDPNLLAVTCLLNAAFPPALGRRRITRAWLSLEAVRILLDHGTPVECSSRKLFHCRHRCAARLRGCVSGCQRILKLGEARGYEARTSQARFVFARFSSWFEPLEISAHHARLAHEALAKCGDMATAGYAIHYSMTVQIDCAPTLDDFAAEVDAGWLSRGGSATNSWISGSRTARVVDNRIARRVLRRRIGCCEADRLVRGQPDGTGQRTSSPRSPPPSLMILRP